MAAPGDAVSARRFLVTGGAGFIGSALVRRLVAGGHRVRVLDDLSRGSVPRLASVADDVELVSGDVRDPEVVDRACAQIDVVCHLASVNGTEFFYTRPELVLDVGIRGMLNVLDAMERHEVGELFLASSSEVYQTPPVVPTAENAPLSVPDPLNPRYSYAGAKIASELLALNAGLRRIGRVVVFRPHNVYGPDMGWEHVIPQITTRLARRMRGTSGVVRLPIQGTGDETRAFCFVDDLVESVALLIARGEHRTVYHLGTDEEVTIKRLVTEIGGVLGRAVDIEPGVAMSGGTLRRCPDLSRIRLLGYSPRISLRAGLEIAARWYAANVERAPEGREGVNA